MSVDDMERVLLQTDTLVEMTMAVVEHENPIAMSETYREKTVRDIFSFLVENETVELRETSQPVNNQEYNNFSCPNCNRSLRIDKSFVSGITSVVIVMVVILLANFVNSPQTEVTFKEARKQEYDNPITNWIEQKHTSEKVEDTYKLGYEKGLTLIKEFATNYDSKINMLCDEAMKADHVANSLYLKGCVSGYKSYFEY